MRQQYESYKPSDIDWIGDIPSHWKLPRVKQFVKINNGSDPKTEGNIPVYGSGSYSFKTCGEFKLGPTVLLGRKGATLHIPHWIEGKYWNVDTAFDTNMIGDLNLRLFFYFSMLFNYEKYKSETTLPSMTQTDYGNMYIPLPPLAEQEAIAAWLDKKCGEIDAAIAKVDREIELIDELKRSEISRAVTHGLNPDAPLRPSGIDWIGDVPEHWGNTRLKFDCSLKGRIGWNGLKSDEFRDLSYAYLVTGQDFKGKNIEWSKCYQIDKWRYDEDPFIQLSNGDLLVTKDGPIGKVALVNNLDKPACLNSGIFVLKLTSKKFKQSYLYWTLVSSQLADFNYFKSGTSTTIQHLYQNIFENMPLVVPPLEEQQAIADYLDKKCAEIDGLRAKLTRKRETLTELRQSIMVHPTFRVMRAS